MGQASCSSCECGKDQSVEFSVEQKNFQEHQLVPEIVLPSEKVTPQPTPQGKVMPLRLVLKLQSRWRAYKERKQYLTYNSQINYIVYFSNQELMETIKPGRLASTQRINSLPYKYKSAGVYIGEWKGGFRDGWGIMHWNNGSKYEGEWGWGRPFGKGRFTFLDGEKFEGDWRDYYISQKEITEKNNQDGFLWLYKKQNQLLEENNLDPLCKDNKKQVESIYEKLVDIRAYVKKVESRVIKAGVPSHLVSSNCRTFSQKFYEDGSVYIGEWKNERRSGSGKLVEKDGTVYEGEWRNDIPYGYGKKTFSNGTYYIGGIKGSSREGWGEFFWDDGCFYVGKWEGNCMHGVGEFVWPDKRTYKGEWENAKMHGFGIMIGKKGQKYEGYWRKGKRHGEAYTKDSQGRVSREEWFKGKRVMFNNS